MHSLMPNGRPAAVSLLTIAVFAISACAGPDETLTLPVAKSIALKMEDKIAALVPERYVALHEQQKKVPLLSCRNDEFTWAGRTRLTLRADPDPSTLLRKVKSGMKQTGSTFRRYELSGGELRLLIDTPHDGHYLVGYHPDKAQLVIDSSSPCFPLKGGNDGQLH